MEFGILPPLTKDYILKRVTQEEIFEHYFGCTAVADTVIESPVRDDDSDPSFGFKYVNGKLKARDFGGYFWGDCFDAVAWSLKVNANSKEGFMRILTDIAKEFRIHKFSTLQGERDKKIITRQSPIKERQRVSIYFTRRKWTRKDGEYWIQFDIDRPTLAYFDIMPAQYIWVNNQLVYTYTEYNPAYVYYWGEGKLKVYYPLKQDKKRRFISNFGTLEGINKIQPAPFGVLTKSYKDVAALYKRTLFGNPIQAIAPPSEGYILSPKEAKLLTDKWGIVYTLMDYDKSGIHCAWEHRKRYNFIPILMRDRVWGRKRGYKGAKDFTDYVELYGKVKAQEIVEHTAKILGLW